MIDDFYLNLLDWSQSNILAVALSQSVYVWNDCTKAVTEVVRVEEGNMISSVSFSDIGRGNYLSVGTLKGEVQIWDLSA